MDVGINVVCLEIGDDVGSFAKADDEVSVASVVINDGDEVGSCVTGPRLGLRVGLGDGDAVGASVTGAKLGADVAALSSQLPTNSQAFVHRNSAREFSSNKLPSNSAMLQYGSNGNRPHSQI